MNDDDRDGADDSINVTVHRFSAFRRVLHLLVLLDALRRRMGRA